MKEILTITNASIRNRNRVFFEHLDFTVREGQHWAIVGPSGSGKTALLKAIKGDYIVSRDGIVRHYYQRYIQSHNISDPLFSHSQLLAYVDVKHNFSNLAHTQDFFYQQRFNAGYSDETQTVEEYLREKEAKASLKGTWDLEKVISDFYLKNLRNKHLIKLSNGETKRLRIAAALLGNPVLLLLDDPFTGLDLNTRRRFEELFKEIAESGTALIMITSPREIPDVITHVLFIDKNRKTREFTRASFTPQKISMNSGMPDLPSPRKIFELFDREGNSPFQILVGMKNVHVSYGNTEVLKGIDWEVRKGERWALSGPNGSGKSTLLSLIYGDHPQAYSNDIVLFDRQRGSGESIWDIKKNIGFMSPELFQYFPGSFSALQVVESGFFDTIGVYRAVGKGQQQKALEWMNVMGISRVRDTLFSDISSALQRLCLLTRALVKSPVLIILDEPCQGFDDMQQKYFRGLIDAVSKQSKLSVIYVTHYREELPECIEKELKLG
jgi:molybdate transport system ATP-binding protein